MSLAAFRISLRILCGLGLSACDRGGTATTDDPACTPVAAASTEDGTTATPSATETCPAATVTSSSVQPAGSNAGGDDPGAGTGSVSDSSSGSGAETKTPDPDSLHLTFTYPTLLKDVYGDHEVSARTATFTHDGQSVQCSHDNGTTFAACDSPSSIVFTAEDYKINTTLKVRVLKDGAAKDFSYGPKVTHPNKEYFHCDTIVSTDKTASEFSDLLLNGTDAAHLYVVCLNAGFKANAAGAMVIDSDSAKNVAILGAGDMASAPILYGLFINDQVAGGGSNADAFKIAGVKFDTNGQSFNALNIGTKQKVQLTNIEAYSSSNSRYGIGFGWYQADITISKSVIHTNAPFATTIKAMIGGNGADNSLINVHDSDVHASYASCDVLWEVSTGYPGVHVNFTRSHVWHANPASFYSVIFTGQADSVVMTFTDSVVEGYYTVSLSGGGGTYNFINSRIISGEQAFFLAGNDTFNFTGGRIEHSAAGNDAYAVDLQSSLVTINDLSDPAKKLLVCKQAATPVYSQLVGYNGFSQGGTFTPAGTANGNNVTVGICPPL